MTSPSRVLLYGASFALRYSGVIMHLPGAAVPPQQTTNVSFASCTADLPVLSQCGEFRVSLGANQESSSVVLESESMTLAQLQAAFDGGELWHVAVGECVSDALFGIIGDGDDDDNDDSTIDLTGLLFVAGVFVSGGAVTAKLANGEQQRQSDPALSMLASRATKALAARCGVAAELMIAVDVAAQVLAFRQRSLVASLQVAPVADEREVLLLWGVRWPPGQMMSGALDALLGNDGAAHVRVLQFSPTAVFDEADNAALLTLCLDRLPRLQALCLKGATGLATTTVTQLVAKHEALRFVCVVGAKGLDLASETARDKIIAVPLHATKALGDRERAKRAAYDWLMASAARRYSVPGSTLAAPAAPAPPAVAQVAVNWVIPPGFVVTSVDVEHSLKLHPDAHKQYVDQVHTFLDAGNGASQRVGDKFPLPIGINQSSLFVGIGAGTDDYVEHRALLRDDTGTAFVDLSLWCAAGFVLVVNLCGVRETIVRWQQCTALQPLLALFAQRFHEWTGSPWRGKFQKRAGKLSLCKTANDVLPVCKAALAAISGTRPTPLVKT